RDIPATSHITMISFCEKYAELHKEGVTDVIHVTINKTGSATYDAAVMARKMFLDEMPDCNMNITIVDSRCYSVAYGYPIMQANKMIDEGMPPEQIIEYLIKRFENNEILLATYTLKFMKKSGRISAAAAFAGELMGFRPVISMFHGKTEVLQKVRGDKLVIPALIAQFKERADDYQDYIIAYTRPEYGEELLESCIREIGYPPKGQFFLGCAVTINAGPQSLGIAFQRK
ncbi:MAG: DegV family protein, partial [Oscillospiraceae bacterium]